MRHPPLKRRRRCNLVIAADGQWVCGQGWRRRSDYKSNAVPESGLAAMAERDANAVSAEEGVGRPIYHELRQWRVVGTGNHKITMSFMGWGPEDITFVVED
jgi:hypothetical protein